MSSTSGSTPRRTPAEPAGASSTRARPRIAATEAPLEASMLEALRRALEDRAEVLTAEVREVELEADRGTALQDAEVADDGEIGEARVRNAVRQAERNRDLIELQEIDAARERMAHGRYGICVDCEMQIPQARLQAQPTAARCIGCQGVYEQAHPVGPAIAPNLSQLPAGS